MASIKAIMNTFCDMCLHRDFNLSRCTRLVSQPRVRAILQFHSIWSLFRPILNYIVIYGVFCVIVYFVSCLFVLNQFITHRITISWSMLNNLSTFYSAINSFIINYKTVNMKGSYLRQLLLLFDQNIMSIKTKYHYY